MPWKNTLRYSTSPNRTLWYVATRASVTRQVVEGGRSDEDHLELDDGDGMEV